MRRKTLFMFCDNSVASVNLVFLDRRGDKALLYPRGIGFALQVVHLKVAAVTEKWENPILRFSVAEK